MNIKELKKKLDELGVDPAEYTLDGGYLEMGIVLNRHRRLFSKDRCDVYWCERGELSYYLKHGSVEKACEVVFTQFQESMKNRSTYVPKPIEIEEARFYNYFLKMHILHIDMPTNITAIYLQFFYGEEEIYMNFSGSSKYSNEGDQWYWEKEFVPVGMLAHDFSSKVISDQESFLVRIKKYINNVIAKKKNGANYIKDKIIFLGFEGKKPILFNINE